MATKISDTIEWPGPGDKADRIVAQAVLGSSREPLDASPTRSAKGKDRVIRELFDEGWSCTLDYNAGRDEFAAIFNRLDPGTEPRTKVERHRGESEERMACAVAKAALKVRGVTVIE